MMNVNQSIDVSDIGRILAIYFPETEFTSKDDEVKLTIELIRFFCSPPGDDLASQVPSPSRMLKFETLHCVVDLHLSRSRSKLFFSY